MSQTRAIADSTERIYFAGLISLGLRWKLSVCLIKGYNTRLRLRLKSAELKTIQVQLRLLGFPGFERFDSDSDSRTSGVEK